jgi:hypothetical protein
VQQNRPSNRFEFFRGAKMKTLQIFGMAILINLILLNALVQAAEKAELNLDKFSGLKSIIEKSDMKDQVMEALKDSGTNWENLASAIASVDNQKRDDLMWLITVMPHLDRLEMTRDILLENIDYAYKAKNAFAYKVPEDMFRQYILVYRIGDEPVTPWRKMIFDRFNSLAAQSQADTAKNVNKWVFDNVKIQKRGFFGPRLSADQIIKLSRGTSEDAATLTTAILKALGIPSRSARCSYFGQQADGANWVEIYDGSKWIPLYPDAPDSFGDFGRWEKDKPHNITVVATTSAFDALQITPDYSQTGKLQLSFYRNGIVQEDFQHFGIGVYTNGGGFPLDDLVFDLEGTKLSTASKTMFEAVLGDGTYLVEAGVRNHNGDVYMFTKQVEVTPGAVIPMEIKLDPPIEDLDREDLVARELEKLPDWELPIFDKDGTIFSNSISLPDYALLTIFNINEEPSKRMISQLDGIEPDSKTKVDTIAIHSGPLDKEKLTAFIKENNITFPVLIDTDGKVAEKYGITRKSKDAPELNNLPSVILLHKGKIIMWREGFDPGIRQFIIDVIKYQQSLGW